MVDKVTGAERFGRNIGTNLQNVGTAAQGVVSGPLRVADYATFQLGNALAGGANTARDVLGGMKAQMRGGKAADYGPTYEGKTLSGMFGGQKPAAAPSAVPTASSAKPGVTGTLPAPNQQSPLAELNALPGIGSVKDWSSARVVNTGMGPTTLVKPTPLGTKLNDPYYAEGNADIYASSTRKDGKFNSFTGVGDANRLNWEQRNPADYQAAVQRAEADKARVVQMARNYAAQGDRAGAARMAFNDPAATAAVENELKTQRLLQASLAGNSTAGGILRQMMGDETSLKTTGMTTETQRRGQDIDAAGNVARNAASKYGVDVAAKTAAEANETHKQQVAATLAAAGAKTMDPAKMSKAAMSELQLSLILGKTRDGKVIDPAVIEDLTKRFMALGGNSNYMMYNSSAAEAE